MSKVNVSYSDFNSNEIEKIGMSLFNNILFEAIVKDNEDEVTYKTNIRGNYHWNTSLDTETGVGTIHFEQSLWSFQSRG